MKEIKPFISKRHYLYKIKCCKCRSFSTWKFFQKTKRMVIGRFLGRKDKEVVKINITITPSSKRVVLAIITESSYKEAEKEMKERIKLLIKAVKINFIREPKILQYNYYYDNMYDLVLCESHRALRNLEK